MNQTDREVRAKVYELFVAGRRDIDANTLEVEGAKQSLERLADEHRVVLGEDGGVLMAHPFSGIDTGHRANVGGQTYWANCAWDALAILALLGDGIAVCPDGPIWEVTNDVVSPGGFVHLLVPAEHFWDDVVFT